ncbi:hypothetical protein ACFQU2_35450 [Siccirubricoccus deserti]
MPAMLPDWGRPVTLEGGTAFAAEGDLAPPVLLPRAVTLATEPDGRPAFRLSVLRALPPAEGMGCLELRLRLQGEDIPGTMLARVARGSLRLRPAAALGTIPPELLAPLPLDWNGLGLARLALPLSQTAATLVEGLLAAGRGSASTRWRSWRWMASPRACPACRCGWRSARCSPGSAPWPARTGCCRARCCWRGCGWSRRSPASASARCRRGCRPTSWPWPCWTGYGRGSCCVPPFQRAGRHPDAPPAGGRGGAAGAHRHRLGGAAGGAAARRPAARPRGRGAGAGGRAWQHGVAGGEGHGGAARPWLPPAPAGADRAAARGGHPRPRRPDPVPAESPDRPQEIRHDLELSPGASAPELAVRLAPGERLAWRLQGFAFVPAADGRRVERLQAEEVEGAGPRPC